MNFDDIIPQTDDKGGKFSLLVGVNGCGKSELFKQLAPRIDVSRILITDPKCEIDYPGYIIDNPADIKQGYSNSNTVIYRPPLEQAGIDVYDDLFRWVHQVGDILVINDELYALSENGVTYPKTLRGLMTRGRTKFISVMNLTQRPSGIPGFARSENGYYYVFDLPLLDDRKRMSEVLGPEVLTPINQYEFWFYNRFNRNRPELLSLKL